MQFFQDCLLRIKWKTRTNLKHFEEMLRDIPIFFRSHKSFIINRQQVKEYLKSDGGYLLLSNGMQAGLSTEKINEFLEGI